MPETLSDMANAVGERDKTPARTNEAPRPADQQIADDQHRREKERIAARRAIRQQIAERDKLMVRVSDLESQLRLLDQRADAAAEKHAAAAEPIQAALAGAVGAKRAALLEKLTTINLDLERELDVINRARNPMLKQHRETRSAAAGLPTDQRLAGGDVASPALLAEKFALEQRLAAAQQRTERARDWVATFDSQLSLASSRKTKPTAFGWTAEHGKVGLDFDRISLLTFRLAKWRAELTDASSEQFAAQQALADLAVQMRAE